MLGVWGRAETTGKALGADIRRKKNSLPVVYAMSAAGGVGRGLLREVYGKPEVTDDDVAAVLGVMEDAGGAAVLRVAGDGAPRPCPGAAPSAGDAAGGVQWNGRPDRLPGRAGSTEIIPAGA